jgi:parallel beta-helix repeat protein
MQSAAKRHIAALGTLFLGGALGFQPLSAQLAATAAVTTSTAAQVVYAGSCGTPNRATISLAVAAAPAGGTVKVCPGIYAEQVVIAKNLNLVGVQSGTADAAVIVSPAGGVVQNSSDTYPGAFPVAAQVLVQNAANVNISNITVDGTGNLVTTCGLDLRGIYYQNASGTLNQVATRNQVLPAGYTGCQSGQGIFVQSGYSTGTAKVAIENSSVSSFDKNGITIDGPGAGGIIVSNFIAGVGPTMGAAENGIQISDGAGGTILGNVVMDEIWAPDTSSQPYNAASGILIYASQNVVVENNVVGSTQYGIVTITDNTSGVVNNPLGLGDHTVINNNLVQNTQIFDAIDVCSNNNSVQGNTIFNATESGIHLDSTCGTTGTKNTVFLNTINESCAGILEGATTGNSIAGTSFANVVTTTLSGNVCTAPTTPTAAVTANAAAAVPATGAVVASAGTSVHPTPVR